MLLSDMLAPLSSRCQRSLRPATDTLHTGRGKHHRLLGILGRGPRLSFHPDISRAGQESARLSCWPEQRSCRIGAESVMVVQKPLRRSEADPDAVGASGLPSFWHLHIRTCSGRLSVRASRTQDCPDASGTANSPETNVNLFDLSLSLASRSALWFRYAPPRCRRNRHLKRELLILHKAYIADLCSTRSIVRALCRLTSTGLAGSDRFKEACPGHVRADRPQARAPSRRNRPIDSFVYLGGCTASTSSSSSASVTRAFQLNSRSATPSLIRVQT